VAAGAEVAVGVVEEVEAEAAAPAVAAEEEAVAAEEEAVAAAGAVLRPRRPRSASA
jgi:hypothetical protein